MSINQKIRNLIVNMLAKIRCAVRKGGIYLLSITGCSCKNCKYYTWDDDIFGPWCVHQDRIVEMDPPSEMICDLYEREQGGNNREH